MSNEWDKSSIAQQWQPFWTKSSKRLKVCSGLFSSFCCASSCLQSWKCCRLVLSSTTRPVLSNENRAQGEGFDSKKSSQTKVKNKMFWYTSSSVEVRHTCGLWAESELVVTLPCVLVKEHSLSLPSKRIRWSRASQLAVVGRLCKQSLLGLRKLYHLHKVCLREEHKARRLWKECGGGGVEVD